MKVGELLPLKVYPAIKMGITVLTFDFIMLAREVFIILVILCQIMM